jgi:hypothetical protein
LFYLQAYLLDVLFFFLSLIEFHRPETLPAYARDFVAYVAAPSLPGENGAGKDPS